MTDKERLEDVRHVLHGPGGTGTVKQVLYAIYVMAILALTYGFTVSRAVFITSDPVWIREHLLGPASAVYAALLTAALTVVVHAFGRRRGPAVPPLPWVDHVVSGPLDRAATLRQWWLVSATVLVACGTVAAGVLGGALWASGATGPQALIAALIVGPALAASLAMAWLTGQVSTGADEHRSHPRPGTRHLLHGPNTLLRSLDLTSLRAQSIRSTRLGGAVLAGDLRAARLETATPVRRGRTLRLRSRGRLATVVARDVLGLRRQPELLLTGALLTVPGAAGLAWSRCDPDVPVVLAMAAALATYLGIGAWAEGLRLLGDTMGTPSLSGLRTGTEAVIHAVAPGALALAVALSAAWGVRALVPATPVGAGTLTLWMVGLTALALGAHGVAAFRGRPPPEAFLPEIGPAAMAFWYARPLMMCVVGSGLLTSRASAPGAGAISAVGLTLAVVGAALWARRALRAAAREHRV